LASADENPSAKFQKPTGPQPSKVDAQKHADILHLLELTGGVFAVVSLMYLIKSSEST